MIYLSADLPDSYCQASAEMRVEQSYHIISPAICDDHNNKDWLVTANYLFILHFRVLQMVLLTLLVYSCSYFRGGKKNKEHSSVNK